MGMYEHIKGAEATLSINGVEFYPESLTMDVPFQKRTIKRTQIMNGTQYISKGDWTPRKFTFDTQITINPERPDEFNDLFLEMCNGECEVVSLDMGSFNAWVEVKFTHESNSPDSLKLSFTVEEIADKTNIPDDEIVIPAEETTEAGLKKEEEDKKKAEQEEGEAKQEW